MNYYELCISELLQHEPRTEALIACSARIPAFTHEAREYTVHMTQEQSPTTGRWLWCGAITMLRGSRTRIVYRNTWREIVAWFAGCNAVQIAILKD